MCVCVCVCFFSVRPAPAQAVACTAQRPGAGGKEAATFFQSAPLSLQVCKEISPEELCSLPLSGCFRPTRLPACRSSGLQDYAGCQAHLRSEGLPEDCDLKSQGPEAVILEGTPLQSRGRLRIRGPVQLRLRLDARHLVLVCCGRHSRQIGQNKAVWPCRREVFDLPGCRCGYLGSWGSDEWRSYKSLGSEDEGFKRHCRPAFPRISTAWHTVAFPADPSPGEGHQSKQPGRCLVGTRFESRARFWCFFLGRMLAGLVPSPLLASPFRSLEGAVLKIRNSTAGNGGGFYARRLSLEPCHMSWA